MRLKKYINEAIQIVSLKDLPDWVKKILKQKKMRKDIEVETTTKVEIGGNWHDANVRDIFLYYKGKIENITGIGTQSPWDNKEDRRAKVGFKTQLDMDKQILVTNSYPKNAKLYVHPEAMIKALPEQDEDDLSKEEKLVLAIMKGLKAAFRRKEAGRYGINYDNMLQQLINKGYATKGKAINKKGKNWLINNFPGTDPIYDIAKKYNIKNKYYGE